MDSQSARRRFLFGAAVMLSCILLSGCIKDKIVIKVNKDGTGKIIVTKVFSKETATTIRAQMKSIMMDRGGGEDEGIAELKKVDPFFNEKALKMQAGRFGPMVTLAKARKFESGGACGYIAVYHFKDVNDIFIDLERLSQDGMSSMYGDMYRMAESSDEEEETTDETEAPVADKSDNTFEFRLTQGPAAKLQILVPSASGDAEQDEEASPEDEEKDDEALEDTEPDEMMMDSESDMMYSSMPGMLMGSRNADETAKRMMKGMAFDLSVEVEGTDIKSNATHVDPKNKSHITLMALDADKIMASPAGVKLMKRVSSYELRNPMDFLANAGKLSGATIETNRDVTVEFK